MLSPSWLRWCTTQSMAAITWEMSVAPEAAPTLTLTSRASGAIPVTSPSSWPATMPPMWVPCPLVSR